jgi:glycine/D-amino acid oxidase-like deaminating enzyme
MRRVRRRDILGAKNEPQATGPTTPCIKDSGKIDYFTFVIGEGAVSIDVTIIGGGLVGTALAYGLATRGRHVVILDEGDVALRASRGNFGLIWVQGKGAGLPAYARWTMESARLYAAFVQDLSDETGIAIGLRQRGGISILLDEAAVRAERRVIDQMRSEAGNRGYECEIIGHDELTGLLPGVGAEVLAGSFCPHDGEVNPLLLLRALHEACRRRGMVYRPDTPVTGIVPLANGGWAIKSGQVTIESRVLVLAAGLGTPKLAGMIGLDVPLRPVRGQIMITERLRPVMELPTDIVRQTEEGTVLIGDTHEEVGLNERTDLAALSAMAARAIKVFPYLDSVRWIRAWGALRIMSPDGFPIYEQPKQYPGLFIVSVHSGVTLAAVHARRLVDWIDGGAFLDQINDFNLARFHVQP